MGILTIDRPDGVELVKGQEEVVVPFACIHQKLNARSIQPSVHRSHSSMSIDVSVNLCLEGLAFERYGAGDARSVSMRSPGAFWGMTYSVRRRSCGVGAAAAFVD